MITVLIILYLVTVIIMEIHIEYSKGGIYHNQKINMEDWNFMLVPLLNTFFAIGMWIAAWPLKFFKLN